MNRRPGYEIEFNDIDPDAVKVRIFHDGDVTIAFASEMRLFSLEQIQELVYSIAYWLATEDDVAEEVRRFVQQLYGDVCLPEASPPTKIAARVNPEITCSVCGGSGEARVIRHDTGKSDWQPCGACSASGVVMSEAE